ncbi:hypothetical protein C8J57DRAFT_1284365 [Mycena rebaudengoi]|nr:hypothetical protein C8J57DRAFT_1284365 [Mycena rebaudengoi]
MSEYWISKKKYYCKYCEIYISDDAPSRQQHENGLRHKGNTERFIRGIYKAGEKKKKDDEEERREMVRVEQAAQIAFAQDVGAGRAKLSSAPAPSAPPPRKPPPKPSNPYTNYSTAKSLGYDDPDAERLAAEAERRRMQGVAGEWQIVAPSTSTSAVVDLAAATESSLKRPADAADEDSRAFKLRKKTVGTGLGQIYDPGAISIQLKKKEEPADVSLIAPVLEVPSSGDKPKWAKLQWKRAGDVEEQQDDGPEDVKREGNSDADVLAKPEPEDPLLDPPLDIKSEDDASVKPEPAQLPEIGDSGKVVFKKRKAPVGGTRGRRQGP